MANYVPRGTKMRCTCGSIDNILNTPTGHGFIYNGQPVMNANDHTLGINITPFASLWGYGMIGGIFIDK